MSAALADHMIQTGHTTFNAEFYQSVKGKDNSRLKNEADSLKKAPPPVARKPMRP